MVANGIYPKSFAYTTIYHYYDGREHIDELYCEN